MSERTTRGNDFALRGRGRGWMHPGARAYPDSTDTVTLSKRGGVVSGSGDRRTSQALYRDSAAAFCTAETFNVTNGLILDW